MNQILIVEASPLAESSSSRKVARTLENALRAAHPGAKVVRRDLARSPVPHLDEETLKAMRAKEGGAADLLKLSDELIAEVMASDVLVVATPMWNFGIPSALKAWVDHVARAGKTFSYSEAGPKGHLEGKKAVVILSTGAVYSSGPMQPMDFAGPYLRAVLGFLGVKDIQVIRAEGLNIPSLADAGLAGAHRAAEAAAV